MSSSSSLPKPSISRDDSICGWKCLRKLGSGGFGSVWKVQNADGILAALKTEFIRKNETETLRIEVSTLRRLQWSEHFCQLVDSFKTDYRDDKLNVLVMSLTGRSLSRMRRMMPRRYFSGSTAIRVSRQCLQAIRDLHSIGYLHRDVKGSNFAWSPESRKVIMLDLGFCRRYLDMDENGSISHRPPRGKAFFTGTSFYCSIYVHKKSEQGRRDDLIAWLYMTVEFFKGKLPWRSLSSDKDIEKAKLKTDSSLFDGMPREVYFINDHIRKLKRQDKPDYGRIFNYIDRICARYNVREEDPYDFEIGSPNFVYFDRRSDTESEMSQDEANDTKQLLEAGEINNQNTEGETTTPQIFLEAELQGADFDFNKFN